MHAVDGGESGVADLAGIVVVDNVVVDNVDFDVAVVVVDIDVKRAVVADTEDYIAGFVGTEDGDTAAVAAAVDILLLL